MVWFAVAALLVALAALFEAFLATRFAQEQVIRGHNDAKDIAKTALEMQYKYGPLQMQTASAIEEKINQRVSQRVRLINTLTNPQSEGKTPAPPEVGEAPAMMTSGIVDEVHEIARGMNRVRRDGVPEELVREPGVGSDIETGGDGTIMQGGKPLEI